MSSQLSAPGNIHLFLFFFSLSIQNASRSQQKLLSGLSEMGPENGKNGAEQGFTSINTYC